MLLTCLILVEEVLSLIMYARFGVNFICFGAVYLLHLPEREGPVYIKVP